MIIWFALAVVVVCALVAWLVLSIASDRDS